MTSTWRISSAVIGALYKVKTRFFPHQLKNLLSHVRAQDFTQSFMHQVSCGVVTKSCAQDLVDFVR